MSNEGLVEHLSANSIWTPKNNGHINWRKLRFFSYVGIV